MNILLTGSSGLIGTELRSVLPPKHRVIRMVRSPQAGADEIYWDPSSGTLDTQALEGLDAVVNLAGESEKRLPVTRPVPSSTLAAAR